MTGNLANRRELLRAALLLVGTAVSASCGKAVLEDPQLHKATSGAFAGGPQDADRMVSQLCDLLLPATQTPGAVEAGVPGFVSRIIGKWSTPAERETFIAGLHALDAAARKLAGVGFAAAPVDAQHTVVSDAFEQVDALAGDRLPEYGADKPFVLTLRDLVVLGFYTSEVGAQQALAFNPMPGRYDGAYPVASVGKHWSY